MAFALPANAGLIPEVSGGYTIMTTPAVDATTGAIPVAPGGTIILDANASVTYSGTSASGVGVTANVYAYLYQGGVQKAESHKTFSRTFDLTSGNTYSVTDTMSLLVPADAAPGDYLLKIVASASADYLGMTYNQQPVIEKYVVRVISTTASSGALPTATPSPAPAPARTNYAINDSSVTARGDGNSTFRSGEVTGETDAGTVSGSVDVNLTGVPEGSLNMYMQSEPDPKAATQFMLAAAESGNDISDIACVLVVEHPTLRNGEDIASATITMKVSRAWVDAHGGISAMKILRYSDGIGEALATTCTNPGGDPLVFQAYSPNGLSQFALAAVASLPLTAAESAPVGMQAGTSLIIGVIAAFVIALVAIVGVVYVLGQRKKNKKQ